MGKPNQAEIHYVHKEKKKKKKALTPNILKEKKL